MKYTDIVKRSGQLVWRYRALWLFGTLLAVTTAAAFPFWVQWNDDGAVSRIPVRVTRYTTIYLPGEGVQIDLTRPGGFLIETHEGVWTDLGSLLPEMGLVQRRQDALRDGWIILGVIGAGLLGTILLSTVTRYVSETALISMVNETEETGKALSVRQGLRRGLSRTAWRLFLIDLTLQVPAILALALAFALALSPLLLLLIESEAAIVAGALCTAGLLVLFGFICLLAWAGLSLLTPLARRACAVDGLGTRASIRRGFAMARASFGNAAVIWLTWLGVRLAWPAVLILIAILLFPVLLLALAGGGVVGGLVAAAVGGLLSLFWTGVAPWVVGIIVGLPILILALILPFAAVRGLVEVFLAGLWTLAYRELRPVESEERGAARLFGASALAAGSAAT